MGFVIMRYTNLLLTLTLKIVYNVCYRVLGLQSTGSGFKSLPFHCRDMTLGKLITYTLVSVNKRYDLVLA